MSRDSGSSGDRAVCGTVQAKEKGVLLSCCHRAACCRFGNSLWHGIVPHPSPDTSCRSFPSELSQRHPAVGVRGAGTDRLPSGSRRDNGGEEDHGQGQQDTRGKAFARAPSLQESAPKARLRSRVFLRERVCREEGGDGRGRLQFVLACDPDEMAGIKLRTWVILILHVAFSAQAFVQPPAKQGGHAPTRSSQMARSSARGPRGGRGERDSGGFFGSMARALVDAVTVPPSPRSEIRKAEAEMMRRKEGRPKVIKPKVEAVAEDAKPAKSRYIPPEHSPSGQKGSVNIEWERRVQFEAMKNGNGIKQNDILMDSLKREG